MAVGVLLVLFTLVCESYDIICLFDLVLDKDCVHTVWELSHARTDAYSSGIIILIIILIPFVQSLASKLTLPMLIQQNKNEITFKCMKHLAVRCTCIPAWLIVIL